MRARHCALHHRARHRDGSREHRLVDPARQLPDLARALGLREVDAAAGDGRSDRAHQRAGRGAGRPAGDRPAQSRDRLRVPGPGPAAVAQRAGKRHAAARGRRRQGAARCALAAGPAGSGRPHRLGDRLSARALGRHAPARGDRPRPGFRPATAADGRTVRRPRRDHARPLERGVAAGLGIDRHHDRVRHPLDLRGGLRRPECAAAGGAAACCRSAP